MSMGIKTQKAAVLIQGWTMDHKVSHKDSKSALLNQGWTIEQRTKRLKQYAVNCRYCVICFVLELFLSSTLSTLTREKNSMHTLSNLKLWQKT